MSSPNVPSRLTLRIPGGKMSTSSQLGVGSHLTTWQGIPHQEARAANKENSPVASLGGGDAVQPGSALMLSEIRGLEIPGLKPLTARQRQALMSPEIPGLETLAPKAVKNLFYNGPVSPRRPSEFWLNNPAWIDGALDPPHFYISRAEIDAALHAAGREVPTSFSNNEYVVRDDIPTAPSSPAGPVPSIINAHSSASNVPIPTPLASVAPPAQGAETNKETQAQGRLTSVTMTYDEIVPGATHNSKSKLKKVSEVKSNLIDFDNFSRTEVVKRIFVIHGISDKYDISPIRGPDFKLWYTGASGGKSGAATISTDEDYAVLIGALRRKPFQTNIGISFDLDAIAAFKIRAKRALALEDNDLMGPGGELLDGAKIPRLDMFSNAHQLHGIHAQYIKNEWQCQQHLGENGRPGACYITPSGKHVGLNIRRLAAWAAAMAAGEATKYQPPNIPDFDGINDAGLSMPRSRGRSGPTAQMVAGPSSSAAEQAMNMMTAFFAAQTKPAPAPAFAAPIVLPPLPTDRRGPSLLTFPLPIPSAEFQRFLEDFRRLKGIDILAQRVTFEASAFTPDILPHISVARLTELTGLPEGHVIKLQIFGKQWAMSLEEARLADGST